MDNKTLKSLMIIITYLVTLILIIINFSPIMQGIWGFIGLFKSFFTGIVIAFVLNKPCMIIERLLNKTLFKNKFRPFTRGISIAVTYLLVIMLVTFLVIFILPQLIESIQVFLGNIGVYSSNLQVLIDKITGLLEIEKVNLSSISSLLLEYINKLGSSITGLLSQIVDITTGVISFFATSLIAAVFSIYLLSGKEKLIDQCKVILGTYLSEKKYHKISYVYHIVKDVFNEYVVGQLTEAFILGSLCFVGMLILRFDYALLISVIIGITALLPYIGAYLGGFIALILLLMISPGKVVWFLIFLVILQQFEGNVIYPRVVGSRLGLPGIWVVLSATVGGGIAGPIGVLFGVPVATILYTLLKNDIEKRVDINVGKE